VAYVAAGGRAVALHGDGVDIVVTGSVAPSVLREVALSLGVGGRRVPASWDEAAVVDLSVAASPSSPLLTLPPDVGFEVPAVRVDGSTVTLTFAGAGERVVVASTRPGDALRPPIDPDAVGVLVRRSVARWSPASGDLEWVEAGRVWSLRSTTLGLSELVGLADAMIAV
jgi:hypothetical protein